MLVNKPGSPSRSSERRLVVPRGNAPRSLAYRASALLLSYETWRKASVMLRPRRCRSCFRDRCSQLISACLPKDLRFVIYDLRAHGGGVVLLTRKSSFVNRKSKLAARVGLAPTPCGLTNRRATLTPPGNGAAGRISTCIVPFRRRMPHVFDHGSGKNGLME